MSEFGPIAARGFNHGPKTLGCQLAIVIGRKSVLSALLVAGLFLTSPVRAEEFESVLRQYIDNDHAPDFCSAKVKSCDDVRDGLLDGNIAFVEPDFTFSTFEEVGGELGKCLQQETTRHAIVLELEVIKSRKPTLYRPMGSGRAYQTALSREDGSSPEQAWIIAFDKVSTQWGTEEKSIATFFVIEPSRDCSTGLMTWGYTSDDGVSSGSAGLLRDGSVIALFIHRAGGAGRLKITFPYRSEAGVRTDRFVTFRSLQ